MPCNSCKKPKFEQAKISPLLARYQKFKNTPQKVNSSINRTPVKKPSRVFTTSKPKVTLSSSTLLQIKSIEKGWIKIPSWFKNNVAWVKEGKISESEFNRGLQSAITQANKNRVTKPIQNTPISVPVNTTPVIESIPEVVKKDCGWFGEKCAFDGVTKAFDEAGKGLDVFVKEEQKKQEDSWNWFNTGVKETQDGIANFFENEGIKQQETIKDIIDYPAQVQKRLDEELKKIDDWQKEQGRLRDEAFSNALENAQLGVDGIITGVSDLGGDITGAFDEFGAGITQFGTDVSTNIGALGTGLDQFGKDLQTNVAGIGEGLDQFGKDMQKNIMALSVIGIGAFVMMGMRK
jgi:hypothetical protein